MVDSPSSYDHDQLLSMCHIHFAYLGNGIFMELWERKQYVLQNLSETTHSLPEATLASGTTCDTESMHIQGITTKTVDDQSTNATNEGTTCDIEEGPGGPGSNTEAFEHPVMTTLMPTPTTSEAQPHTDVSKSLLHQDSDKEGYSDNDVTMGADDTINVESHVTSPVQFTDEPPTSAAEVVTVKSDPDTIAEFLSSSADTIPIHVLPKRENGADIDNTTHVLLSSTTLKPASVWLCKLTDTDIDLWTMPKPCEPEKGPLKTMQVVLDKQDVSTSDETTLSIKQGSGKPKKSKKLKSVSRDTSTKPKGTQGPNRPTSASPKLSSRVTDSQKIRSGLKSPIFRITMHGLKCFKHRYYHKCGVNP